MTEQSFEYIIVGGGLAGAYAAKGIREHDREGSILLLGNETYRPYDRPPLSKKLWFGKKKVEDIFVEDEHYYASNGIDLKLATEVVSLNAVQKAISTKDGDTYRYNRLLLSTGGTPRRLDIPGGNIEGISYYRYLDDYLLLRSEAGEGKSVVVVGGGFIGSEMAAALNINKVNVTMIFPEPYLLYRIFPAGLGQAIQNDYINRGVKVMAGDVPASFEKSGSKFITTTKGGSRVESDMVVVGVGIVPTVALAKQAQLDIENGIVVNEYLQSSDSSIYAAGDNACFPYPAIGKRVRIEHWDNAVNQGKHVGANMAGANEPFTYMPYFFSDLFDFGFEAVGETDSRYDIFEDWQKENDTGVIYYLQDGKVRGAMMCNVWDKVDAAREIIREGKPATPEDLRGAIK